MKNMVLNVLGILSKIFLCLVLICWTATGIIGYQDRNVEYSEIVKDFKPEFYNIDKILSFDDHLFCLNRSANLIMVFTDEDSMVKIIQLPKRLEKGYVDMYIYHEKLCIRDKQNALHQYSSFNEFQKLTWDHEKINVYSKNGEKLSAQTMTEEMYACLLLYDESKCYIDYELGNSVSIFENMRLVGTENIDYEQDIDGNNQKAFLSGEEYQIQGFFRNRLVKITSEGEYQVYKGFPLRAIVLSAKSIFFLTLAWILCELCKRRMERL